MHKIFWALLVFLFLFVPLLGSDTIKANPDDSQKFTIIEETRTRSFPNAIRTDTNDDGDIDFIVLLDEDGMIIAKEQDFNHDGYMDDFYYYKKEVLIRREVDSNYDRVIDIWVYLSEGVYVEWYERDTDFDGSIDKIKKYGADQRE